MMGFFDKVKKSIKTNKKENKEFKEENKQEKVESEETKSFKYLDDLIHSEAKEITLDSDIVFEESEKSKYIEGIEIDVDNLIINGNYHTIDAKCKTRIFYSTGKNITIKNITLKNGSSDRGGAIVNNGQLSMIECILTDNEAKENGGAIYNSGKLQILESTLSKNRASLGGAVYNGGTLHVSELSFNENLSVSGGGIYNVAEMIIDKSLFDENTAKNDGGVIFNGIGGNLSVNDCLFINNRSEKCGGVISNNKEAYLDISNSSFKENFSNDGGTAIFNLGVVKIIASDFVNHFAVKSLFYNGNELYLMNSIIAANRCDEVVLNNDQDSYFESLGCKISKNLTNKSALINWGNSNIADSTFDNKNSNNLCEDIINKSNLDLVRCKFASKQNICNEGRITVKKMDITPHIYPPIHPPVPPEERFGFEYLKELIHENASNEIVIDRDIRLQDHERDFYEGGIELNIDDLIIDGNGHTIDGANKSRVFIITGKNITLKNIEFRNGFMDRNYYNYLNYGAAIQVNPNASLNIENCFFIDNISENSGGAIFNKGQLHIRDTNFENNRCKLDGGAIFNGGYLNISNVKFCANKSKIGSAIYNNDDLDIEDDIFLEDNEADLYNAIYTLNPIDVSDFDLNPDEMITQASDDDSTLEEKQPRWIKSVIGHNNENSAELTNDEVYVPRKRLYSDFVSNVGEEEYYDVGSSYSKWKTAYIFISSTFNDMHAERDYLIKEVFPELSEWCEERKIHLKDIDLRWGVSEEDSKNNQTIEKCLRHIDKSRPFFLCFLGQRRGWIPKFPEDISEKTKSIYPDINDFEGKSATEMEIEHALLHPLHLFLKDNDFDCKSSNSLFFFRDGSYLENLSDAQRKIYTNESEEDVALADKELQAIKDRIRQKQSDEIDANKTRIDEEKIYIDIIQYTGRWDSEMTLAELSHFENGEDKGRLTDFRCGDDSLKDVLLEQLKEQLKNQFPENMTIQNQTDFERNLDLEENFCYLNSEGYIPRPKYMEKLEDYVNDNSNNNICVVTAEAGFGKTTLLSKFAFDFENKFHNVKLSKRFCGASDFSTDAYRLWKSIIDEIGIGDEEIYPHNLQELQDNLSDIFKDLTSDGKCVIIIDAINQMSDGIFMFKWLEKLPDNLKIIVSIKKDSINEKHIEIIRNLNFTNSFEIEGLTDAEKRKLINKYLSNYLKTLDDGQIDVICKFKASNNALFLKILLSELRVFGSFEQLEGKIQMFGDSPISAFKHVLGRLENDEMKGNKVTQLMFSMLASARSGLSETELIAIIKSQTDLDEKTIRDTIRINVRQLRVFMKKTEGLHDFFYDSFKIAAKEKYGDYNELLLNYFKNIADPNGDYSFLGNGTNNLRGLNELPYHLNQSENYVELAKVLSSFSFIKNKLELSGIDSLISDYNFSQNHKFRESDYGDSILLIGKALEFSQPILSMDEYKNQLPMQLWGRLCQFDTATINSLLDELIKQTKVPWFKSTASSLYSPKNYVVKSLYSWGSYEITSIVIMPNKKIVWGNSAGILSIYHFNENFLEIGINDEFSIDGKIIRIIQLDESEILLGYDNGMIQQWDINTRDLIKFFYISGVELTDICLSFFDEKIYASSSDGVYSIDLKSENIIKESIDGRYYNQILFSPLHQNIFVLDDDKVEGWNIDEMRKVFDKYMIFNDDEEFGESESNPSIRFMGINDRFLHLINSNGIMMYFNALKVSGGGEAIDQCFVCGQNDEFAQAKVLPEENKIITLSDMGVLRIWDDPKVRSTHFTSSIDMQTNFSYPTALDYYYDGKKRWVAAGNIYGIINIMDLNKATDENTIVKHTESVFSIEIHNNHMITVSDNGEIFTWDFDNEELKNKFTIDFRCNSISYNREDSKLVLTGVKAEKDGRRTYKIATCTVNDDMWETNDKESIELESDEIINSKEIIDIAQNNSGIVFIEEHKLSRDGNETKFDKTATTLAVKFDSDDAYVGFEDGNIVKYPDQITFEKVNDFEIVKIKIQDGRLIAGYSNGDIGIYDLNGSQLASLKGHNKAINDFCLNNNLLVSVSKDNTLRLWDINSNELLFTQFLDVYATSVNFKDDMLILGLTLGEVIFFSLENQ